MNQPVKITTPEMEVALANWFDYRVNLIVPCVYWGLGLDMHECDLLIVSKAGYVTEVEIKISRADLRKDREKPHGHQNKRIKYLYFAVPEKLEAAAIEFAPERAGIIVVRDGDNVPGVYPYHQKCRRVRVPVCQKNVGKMTDRDRYKVARLGALRIWRLKRMLVEKQAA